MDSATDAVPVLEDRDLVLHFESVGDNCELGFAQRMAGAEPAGLLSFAGAPVRSFIRALNNRFRGAADPDSIRVQEENGEYMVKLTRYDVYYHAHIRAGDATAEAVYAQQCRTVGELVNTLISDLENPKKILVFRQNEPLLASDLGDLRLALSAYGNSTLLWVQDACPGHPPGTVAVADERLLLGYVNRLAPRNDVPNLHHASWMSVLRKAHAIWSLAADRRVAAGREAAAQMRRVNIEFGLDGNAQGYLGYGWSGPEAGYQWSVGERSLVTLPNLGSAAEYWLEMDASPFVSPPLLRRQRLDISVNGSLVRSIDPLPRGTSACIIPGTLITPDEPIRIRLDHPFAASPILVAGGTDDRRLAISFNRMALFAL